MAEHGNEGALAKLIHAGIISNRAKELMLAGKPNEAIAVSPDEMPLDSLQHDIAVDAARDAGGNFQTFAQKIDEVNKILPK